MFDIVTQSRESQRTMTTEAGQANDPQPNRTLLTNAEPDLFALRAAYDLYHELLFAVARKYPNETRHQTALRYIHESEVMRNSGPASAEIKRK